MASGELLAKLRNIYAKADEAVRQWNELQEDTLARLKLIAMALERLPALQEPGNYSALRSVPDIQQKLLAKQMLALEQHFAELQTALTELGAVCRALEKLSRNAQQLVQQAKGLTKAARAASVGPVPSIDQCLQGLQEIWQIHSEELRLKEAIVSEVGYATPKNDMQHILGLYAAQPNIDRLRVQDLLYVVAATEEAPHLR